MSIGYEKASELQLLVSKAHHLCGESGMGSFISISHFEEYPFDAALIALAKLWTNIDAKLLENFLWSWQQEIRKDNVDGFDVDKYIEELRALVYYALEKTEIN